MSAAVSSAGCGWIIVLGGPAALLHTAGMRPQYPGLDIIRLSAATLVTAYHLGFLHWSEASDAVAERLRSDLAAIAPVASSGWVGVPIFFMLSGFVIAFSAEGSTVGRFARSRIARLYPAAWLCSGLTALAIVGQADLGARMVRSLALWPWGPWVSQVYWTLGVEIGFYIVVAAVMASRLERPLHALATTLAVIGSGYWVARLVDFATGSHLKPIFGLAETPYAGVLLINNATHFGFGLVLWSMARSGVSRGRLALLAACLVGGVISTAASARFNVELHGEPAYRILVAPAIYLAAAGALVLAVVWNTAIVRAVGAHGGTVRAMGLLTYPLYLVHNEWGAVIIRSSAKLGSWPAFLLGVGAVTLMAAAILRLERYPRAAVLRLLPRSSAAGQLPA